MSENSGESIFVKVRTRLQMYRQKYVEKYVIPPYDEKRRIIREYKDKYGLNIFIESGTFLGDTIEEFKKDFKQLFSIELSKDLAEKASKRFGADRHIQIVNGDSGKEIANILRSIHEPCLFWLDGHYSSEFFIGTDYIVTAKGEKDTPIIEELKSILSHEIKNHVILIDDARYFTGKTDYPSLSEITAFVKRYNPKAVIVKKRDLIRIAFS